MVSERLVRRFKTTEVFSRHPLRHPQEHIDRLAASLKALTQQVPGIVRWDEERQMWECLSGNGRLAACRINGMDFEALEAPAGMSQADCIKLLFAVDDMQNRLSPLDKADNLAAYMQDTGCSREAAAEALGISPGEASKAMTVKALPADLHQYVSSFQIAPSVAYLIAAGLKDDPGKLRSVFMEAMEKKLPRKRVQTRIKEERGEPDEKPEELELRYGCVRMTVSNPSNSTIQAALEKILAAVKKAAKQQLPANVIPDLLKGGGA